MRLPRFQVQRLRVSVLIISHYANNIIILTNSSRLLKTYPRAGEFIGRFIARRSITRADNRNYTVHVINVVRKLRNDYLRSYHNNNTLIISGEEEARG